MKLKPKIVYKNNNFLIIDKPAGLLVHQSVLNKNNSEVVREETLVDWLIEKYPQIKKVGDDVINRPGIVHRLDKETSGLMIVPLHQDIFEYFKNLFQEHKIKKTYLVLVDGNVKSDNFVIDKPIGIKSGTTRRSVHCAKMSKNAITEFSVVRRYQLNGKSLTLLRAYPKTGRTHQIRVHLAYIHCPVVGDKLYGKKNNIFPEITRQFLHAEVIEFPILSKFLISKKYISGKMAIFKSKLPKDLNSFLKSIE